jgi:hypothetical protein
MKTYYFYIIILIGLTAESHGQVIKNYYNESILVDSFNVPLDDKQFYFPTELFPKVEMVFNETSKDHFLVTPKTIENSIDSFCLSWFSSFLYAMNEPLLFNKYFGKEIYRFTILRTFHNPIMLRLEKDLDSYCIYWKETDGKGGYEPGSIICDKKKKIDKSDWFNFISMLDSMQFWTMGRSTSWGTDGSEWILEGTKSDQYHVVSIWSPGESGYFQKSFLYLLKFTDIKIKKDEIY